MQKLLITLDYETYYDASTYTLKRMSVEEYVRDERFEPLCLAVKVGNAPAKVAPPDKIQAVLSMLPLSSPNTLTIMHNAAFDNFITEQYYGVPVANPLCTILLGRWAGTCRLAGESLAAQSEFLGVGAKGYGTVMSNGKRRQDFTRAEWADFVAYARQDAELTYGIYKAIEPALTDDCLRFIALSVHMYTRPRFVIDGGKLAEYIEALEQRREDALVQLAAANRFSGVDDMLRAFRSKDRFAAMLRGLGVEPPMKQSPSEPGKQIYAFAKQDLEFMALADHEDERVSALVTRKLELSGGGAMSRAKRLLAVAQRGRLPIELSAFAAHTGRYGAGATEGASGGLNSQNMEKRTGDATIRQSIRAPKGYVLVAADSAQIEARVLAYIANQTDLIAAFAGGRDVYSEFGEKVYQVPADEIRAGAKAGDKRLTLYRTVAKTCVLQLGYQSGAKKLAETLLRSGAKLSEDREEHYERAAHAHAVYRESHPHITGFWRTCGYVVRDLARGGSGTHGGPQGTLFTYGLFDVAGLVIPGVRLPDGYTIFYPNLRKDGDEYVYDRRVGKNTTIVRLYAGKYCENVDQSLSFSILRWQACRMAEEGLIVCGNVHDSWGALVPEADAAHACAVMEKWMKTAPPWAPGLPLSCDVKSGDTYDVM